MYKIKKDEMTFDVNSWTLCAKRCVAKYLNLIS